MCVNQICSCRYIYLNNCLRYGLYNYWCCVHTSEHGELALSVEEGLLAGSRSESLLRLLLDVIALLDVLPLDVWGLGRHWGEVPWVGGASWQIHCQETLSYC